MKAVKRDGIFSEIELESNGFEKVSKVLEEMFACESA